MGVLIPDEIIQQANLSESEFKLELAIFLYTREILPLGKASVFAGLPQLIFRRALAKRRIPISYDQTEFDKDIQVLQEKYPEM